MLARVACSIQANLDSTVRIVGSEGRIEVPSPWLPGRIGGDARILARAMGPEHGGSSRFEEDRDVYTVEVDAVSRAVRGGRTFFGRDGVGGVPRRICCTLDRWRSAIGLQVSGRR